MGVGNEVSRTDLAAGDGIRGTQTALRHSEAAGLVPIDQQLRAVRQPRRRRDGFRRVSGRRPWHRPRGVGRICRSRHCGLESECSVRIGRGTVQSGPGGAHQNGAANRCGLSRLTRTVPLVQPGAGSELLQLALVESVRGPCGEHSLGQDRLRTSASIDRSHRRRPCRRQGTAGGKGAVP